METTKYIVQRFDNDNGWEGTNWTNKYGENTREHFPQPVEKSAAERALNNARRDFPNEAYRLYKVSDPILKALEEKFEQFNKKAQEYELYRYSNLNLRRLGHSEGAYYGAQEMLRVYKEVLAQHEKDNPPVTLDSVVRFLCTGEAESQAIRDLFPGVVPKQE